MGKRNYHYFFLFICSLNLTQIFVAIFSIVHISVRIAFDVKEFKKNNLFKGKEVKVAFCNVVISIWCICFVAISMIFTTGLLIFHIKIIKVNKTTKEELKHLFINPFYNPFQRSTKDNLITTLIPNISKKSLIDELRANRFKYQKYLKEESLENKKKDTPIKKKVDEKYILDDDDKTNLDNENIEKNNINITIDDDNNKDSSSKINRKKVEDSLIKNKKKKNNNANEKNHKFNEEKLIENKLKNKNKQFDNSNLLDKITNIEEKSSSNDILTNHTNKEEEIINEKIEEENFNSPIKNKVYTNINNNVNVLESHSYLPPSTTKKIVSDNGKEELNSTKNKIEKKRGFPQRKKK